MLVWNPARGGQRGEADLVPWPDATRQSMGFSHSWGACDLVVQLADPDRRRFMLACQLLTMILRDGVDRHSIHRACWPLQEYRDCLPHDVHGPDGQLLPTSELADRVLSGLRLP